MQDDNRVAERFLFSDPVAFGQPDFVINGSVAGNISLSGISLKVQSFVPMGIILELQIRLGASPKVIWVRGKVVRIRQVLSEDCFEIGLKFIKDEASIKAIGEYINAPRKQ